MTCASLNSARVRVDLQVMFPPGAGWPLGQWPQTWGLRMWFPASPQRTANQGGRWGLLPPSPLFWPWTHLERSLHEGLWQGAQDATGEAKLDSSTSSQNCHLGTLARGSGGTPGKEFTLSIRRDRVGEGFLGASGKEPASQCRGRKKHGFYP